MARTVEIAVVDASRGMGNGWMLPAGPLREPSSRLDRGRRGGAPDEYALALPPPESRCDYRPCRFPAARSCSVDAPPIIAAAASFHMAGVHAIAGIGNPERFFEHLAIARYRRDMSRVSGPPSIQRAADLAFADATAILMTEKDAVKCARVRG